MNRAFFVVLAPAGLVAIGYVVVFRQMGLRPPYGILGGMIAALVLGFWWFGRRARKKV